MKKSGSATKARLKLIENAEWVRESCEYPEDPTAQVTEDRNAKLGPNQVLVTASRTLG